VLRVHKVIQVLKEQEDHKAMEVQLVPKVTQVLKET
jgi:hypothetical protein